MLKKMLDAFNVKRSGNVGVMILILLVIIVLVFWFFFACYGWMVAAFPTFVAFPRWAFVLLLFMICSGGGSNANRN